MKLYEKVRSKVKPEPQVIDEYSVWMASDIASVSDTGPNGEVLFEGYEYDLAQYTKDEYIKLMDEKNANLETQVTDTQIALCEVYEMMMV